MISKSSNFKSSLNLFSILLIICFTLLNSCGVLKKKDDRKYKSDRPLQAEEKRKQNIKEGRGASLGKVLKRGGNTSYEFSTSNPMWRASLETLDFLPLSVVDYSGGVIITDWYGSGSNDALKITLRFLSNEVRSDSIKVIVHQKKCSTNVNCKINILDSQIRDELLTSIIKKAAILEKKTKKK